MTIMTIIFVSHKYLAFRKTIKSRISYSDCPFVKNFVSHTDIASPAPPANSTDSVMALQNHVHRLIHHKAKLKALHNIGLQFTL